MDYIMEILNFILKPVQKNVFEISNSFVQFFLSFQNFLFYFLNFENLMPWKCDFSLEKNLVPFYLTQLAQTKSMKNREKVEFQFPIIDTKKSIITYKIYT